MYDNPYRRQGNGTADARARRRPPVEARIGGIEGFHARLVRAAREAALRTGREEFFERLEQRFTDERQLLWSLEHNRRYGGQAPGIDGMRYSDIPETLRWAFVRRIRDQC